MRGTSDTPLDEPEETLVEKAIRGDAHAFGQLYTRHLDAIYRYVFFRVDDPALAEDLTEDVFVRAWEALPKYKQRQHPFTSWLYRIAHNLVVDHRRKKRDVSVESLPRADSADPGPTPGQLVAEQQDAATLARAVQQLDDEAQQVILLRFVEGLSHREIAGVIGKSEGASRVIQHRALAALHTILGEQEHHDG